MRSVAIAGVLVWWSAAGSERPAGIAPLLRAAPAAAPLPAAVRLWPTGAPEAQGRGEAHEPAIYPFLPSASKRTGAGVLVVPGGGFTTLDTDREGAQVAAWLNERGIAAFVLRYRLLPAYQKATAIADTTRAIQYVRSHAADFNVAPARLGALGFGSGAELAAAVAYRQATPGDAAASDPVARAASSLAFVGLIDGSAAPDTLVAGAPATFLAGSSRQADHQDSLIDLWTRLRAARVPVDTHIFARADVAPRPAPGDAAANAWPDSFYNWLRYRGYLTDATRVGLRGMAWLDGRPLPHGYVVLTPLDTVGAGPIVARVLNSTAGVPIGQFTVPASQGPVPGRYRVEVHQNANRWLSNAFTAALIKDPAFGHSRILSPSIDGLKVYGRVHPADKDSYVVQIGPAGDQELKIEVFSGAAPTPAMAAAPPGSGETNPGLTAYAAQLAHAPNPAPGVPQPIMLWPQGAPGAVPDANGVFTDEDKPAIYAYPAAAASNTGAAFLVLPGGAFTNRAIDQEGIQVARWLNGRGISAFVLRYRIRPNYPGQVSTMDAHRAMRYIRSHASEYSIDADRIGTIGFSAGAELEGDAFFNTVLPGDPAAADPLERISTRSNFNVLIYGGRNVANPASAPPTFMFVTLEDGGGHLAPQINVLNGLRGAGIPVEAHWFQEGPHGTALAVGDPQLGQWPDLMVKWLKAQGLLATPRSPKPKD